MGQLSCNPMRGEVEVVVNGQPHIARLTLGTLAELEAGLDGSLLALVERFEAARFSALDILGVLFAGLRGGGWHGSMADLRAAELEGGALAAAAKAGQLLALAFALPPQSSA